MKAKLCQILLDHGNEILLLVDAATLEICSANAAAALFRIGQPEALDEIFAGYVAAGE